MYARRGKLSLLVCLSRLGVRSVLLGFQGLLGLVLELLCLVVLGLDLLAGRIDLAVHVAVAVRDLGETLTDQPAQTLQPGVPRTLLTTLPLRIRIEPGKTPDVPRSAGLGNVDVTQKARSDHRADADDALRPFAEDGGVGVGREGGTDLVLQGPFLGEQPLNDVVRLRRFVLGLDA